MGPVAELDPVALRRQFDTNVVGAMAVIRAVVPGMVRQGSGCIVNVGSVSGLLPTPFAGAYCASKAALHALTDALRLELAPFGIRVVSLQPGGVASRFGEAAGAALGGDDAASLYAPMRDAIRRRAATSQEGAMDAAAFARRVVDAVTARTPPAVLRVGTRSKQMPLLRWLLPVAVLDRILARRFGLAGRGAPGAGK
jgi:NAD(P)-dependent dehydrogenase (short-subunit alcohol dehydrogenase family)